MRLSVSLLCLVVAVRAQSAQGIVNLLKRRLPAHVEDFVFQLTSNNTGLYTSSSKAVNDEYHVSSTTDGKILVQGNSLIALLSG